MEQINIRESNHENQIDAVYSNLDAFRDWAANYTQTGSDPTKRLVCAVNFATTGCYIKYNAVPNAALVGLECALDSE